MNLDDEETEETRKMHGKVNPVIAREYVEKNYIHKDKAKEIIEDIIDYFEYVNVPDEDIEFLNQKKSLIIDN